MSGSKSNNVHDSNDLDELANIAAAGIDEEVEGAATILNKMVDGEKTQKEEKTHSQSNLEVEPEKKKTTKKRKRTELEQTAFQKRKNINKDENYIPLERQNNDEYEEQFKQILDLSPECNISIIDYLATSHTNPSKYFNLDSLPRDRVLKIFELLKSDITVNDDKIVTITEDNGFFDFNVFQKCISLQRSLVKFYSVFSKNWEEIQQTHSKIVSNIPELVNPRKQLRIESIQKFIDNLNDHINKGQDKARPILELYRDIVINLYKKRLISTIDAKDMLLYPLVTNNNFNKITDKAKRSRTDFIKTKICISIKIILRANIMLAEANLDARNNKYKNLKVIVLQKEKRKSSIDDLSKELKKERREVLDTKSSIRRIKKDISELENELTKCGINIDNGRKLLKEDYRKYKEQFIQRLDDLLISITNSSLTNKQPLTSILLSAFHIIPLKEHPTIEDFLNRIEKAIDSGTVPNNISSKKNIFTQNCNKIELQKKNANYILACLAKLKKVYQQKLQDYQRDNDTVENTAKKGNKDIFGKHSAAAVTGKNFSQIKN